ncbi:hypothetical protein NDU88_006070 [Pleurodeles waltl]|uniref:Uncharacterized protein n=1 Tax=Pleurodeles waltl TaxID=8319 RepID=A0AAV7L2R4_PLEWA|nr:hypothetical protein NDU88_006070 [Pleurodeles waltl]
MQPPYMFSSSTGDFVDGKVVVDGLSSGAEEGFLKVVRTFGGGVEGSEEGLDTSFKVEGWCSDFEEDFLA